MRKEYKRTLDQVKSAFFMKGRADRALSAFVASLCGSSILTYRLHHLCLDKGYDYDDVIEGVLARDYILHLRKIGEESAAVDAQKKHPARRWVVERTHAWHNRFRRLLVRWEKKDTHYEALIHVASILIIFRIVTLWG